MALFDRLKQTLFPKGRKLNYKDPADFDDSYGNVAVSPHGKQMSVTESEKQTRVARLTTKEYALFQLLLEGFTLKESAKQLSVKYSTANTHMTSLYRKLGINSRAELIINYRDIDKANQANNPNNLKNVRREIV